ncbi:hypothetical protein ACIQGZ_07525 [Streptomyces sp. NPDC092296]|uniref:Rv1733c family protein n=1 Tax=Streptomyces sp. NPDC092296 TaxID=3366012 RepID=UPI0038117E8E
MAAETAQPHGGGSGRGPVRTLARRTTLCLRQACAADRNPLCRSSDRRRARLLLALVAMLLLAPLLAALASGMVYRHGRDAAAAQAARRHQVTAVTQVRAPDNRVRVGQQFEVPTAARWSYPAGHARSGPVMVAPGTAAGTKVPLWVDGAGQPTQPPRSRADIAADAWFAAAGTLAAFAALTVTGAGIARRSLERRDDEAWARQWAEVEPDWSGRRPHGIDGR